MQKLPPTHVGFEAPLKIYLRKFCIMYSNTTHTIYLVVFLTKILQFTCVLCVHLWYLIHACVHCTTAH